MIMTDENGNPENDSKIQNEEHDHSLEAKRVVTVDSTGSLLEEGTRRDEAGVIKQAVTDENALSVLEGIHKQLKIMNIHLSKLSDEHIDDEEVE